MNITIKQDGLTFARQPNSIFGTSKKKRAFSGFSDSSEKVLAKYLSNLGPRLSRKCTGEGAANDQEPSCAVNFDDLFGESVDGDADQVEVNLNIERPQQLHSIEQEGAPLPHPEVGQKNIHLVQSMCTVTRSNEDDLKSIFDTSSEPDLLARLFDNDDGPDDYVDQGAASEDSDAHAVEMVPWLDVLQEKFDIQVVQEVVHRVSTLFRDVEEFFTSRATSDELVAIKASGQTQMPFRFKAIFLAWFQSIRDGLDDEHQVKEVKRRERPPISSKATASKTTAPKVTPSKPLAAIDRKAVVRDSMVMKSHRTWRDLVDEYFPDISLPAHSSSRICTMLDDDVRRFLERECSDEKEYMSGRRMRGIPSYLIEKFVFWFRAEIVSNMIIPQTKTKARRTYGHAAVKVEQHLPEPAPVPVLPIISHSLPFMKRNAPVTPDLPKIRVGRIRKKDRLETITVDAKRRKIYSPEPDTPTTTPSTVVAPPVTFVPPPQEQKPLLEAPAADLSMAVFCLYMSADGRYLCPKCRLPHDSLTTLDGHIKECSGTVVIAESTTNGNSMKDTVQKRKTRLESTITPTQSPIKSHDVPQVLTPPQSSKKTFEPFSFEGEETHSVKAPLSFEDAEEDSVPIFDLENECREIISGIEPSQPGFEFEDWVEEETEKFADLDSSILSQFAQPSPQQFFSSDELKIKGGRPVEPVEDGEVVEEKMNQDTVLIEVDRDDQSPIPQEGKEVSRSALPLSSEVDLSSEMDEDDQPEYCGSPEW